MTSWLMDTALLNHLATPKARSLLHWLETNDASVFLSVVSLTEASAGIAKISGRQPQRGEALRAWFDELIAHHADRIDAIDPEIAARAGELLPSMQNGIPRHRLHDALLVATAQIRGRGLLTRRDPIFGPWTNVPVAVI